MELTIHYKKFCETQGFTQNADQLNVVRILEDYGRIVQEAIVTQKPKGILEGLLQKFIPSEKEHDIPYGVYIYGGVGRGKSMLMDLFFKHLPLQQKKRVHFHHFMQDVHASLKKARMNPKVMDALLYVADDIASTSKFICFDEFQVLDITDAMILGRLFNALIDRGVHFVMTSNRHPDELYLNGLNRQLFLPFIELLKSKFTVVSLDHETDYRLEKIRHHNHYMHPLNQKTHDDFEKIWQVLTDYHIGEECVLENAGRKIKLVKTFKNILHADFSDLCDNPLGAGDYIMIAEQFEILLLDHMPQLTSDMRNQATRFRNLIDAFYEGKRKVYFRAEVPVEDLYIKGDYSFEFERTISRIQEMQSIN